MKSRGREVTILNYRLRNRGTQRLNDLLKVTCLTGAGPNFRGELLWWSRVLERTEAGREGINDQTPDQGTEESSVNR